MGTEPKNVFFYHFTKIKVGGGCFCAHMYAYNVFLKKIKFWFVYEGLKIAVRVNFYSKH